MTDKRKFTGEVQKKKPISCKNEIATFIFFIAFVLAVFTTLVIFGASKNPARFFDNAFIPLLAVSAIALTAWLSTEAMKGGK